MASGTVIGGENLGWMFSKPEHAKLPAMFRMMMPRDRVWIMKDARRVADRDRVLERWQRVLTWPARTLMSYHDPPGHGFSGDAQAALRAAVDAAGQLGTD